MIVVMKRRCRICFKYLVCPSCCTVIMAARRCSSCMRQVTTSVTNPNNIMYQQQETLPFFNDFYTNYSANNSKPDPTTQKPIWPSRVTHRDAASSSRSILSSCLKVSRTNVSRGSQSLGGNLAPKENKNKIRQMRIAFIRTGLGLAA